MRSLNAGPHSDPDPPPRVLRDHSARSFLLARVYTERLWTVYSDLNQKIGQTSQTKRFGSVAARLECKILFFYQFYPPWYCWQYLQQLSLLDMPRCPWKVAYKYMYFDCVQKTNLSRCRRTSAKISRPLTLNKFLLENCAEEMSNVRITTSWSSLEAMRRSEGLPGIKHHAYTNLGPSKVVSITRLDADMFSLWNFVTQKLTLHWDIIDLAQEDWKFRGNKTWFRTSLF